MGLIKAQKEHMAKAHEKEYNKALKRLKTSKYIFDLQGHAKDIQAVVKYEKREMTKEESKIVKKAKRNKRNDDYLTQAASQEDLGY